MGGKYITGLYIAAVYIGALMGAGFATGRELMGYFVRFGVPGLVAIGGCGILFAIIGYRVLYFMHIRQVRGYREFLQLCMGKRLGTLTEGVSFCFIIALYASMLAATGALTRELWGLRGGSLAMAIACSLLVYGGVQGLGRVNMLLCPLLIGGSALVGLWLYFGSVEVLAYSPAHPLRDNALGSALVYASYNIISGISLLCAMGSQVGSKRDALLGGILGGCVIGLVGLLLALPLYKYMEVTLEAPLPVLRLIMGAPGILRVGYVTVLFSAIVTTALGNCYSAVAALSPVNRRERMVYTALVTCAALLLSVIGFEGIVDRLYYLFGCLGLVELIGVLRLDMGDRKREPSL